MPRGFHRNSGAIWGVLRTLGCYTLAVGKGSNNRENGRLYITATPELRMLLDGLAALGIHGGSAAEVARHFVENEVERMVRDGVVEKALESRRRLEEAARAQREVAEWKPSAVSLTVADGVDKVSGHQGKTDAKRFSS